MPFPQSHASSMWAAAPAVLCLLYCQGLRAIPNKRTWYLGSYKYSGNSPLCTSIRNLIHNVSLKRWKLIPRTPPTCLLIAENLAEVELHCAVLLFLEHEGLLADETSVTCCPVTTARHLRQLTGSLHNAAKQSLHSQSVFFLSKDAQSQRDVVRRKENTLGK